MKVFLSSTYDDLSEHRKAAHDALEKLDVQVIWMESFGARPEDSTTACLKEVEESDLFIGIYAHRYGYIPKGADVSITEQEFDHAQGLNKPTYGFIVNEDHAWSPKHIEHDRKDKLDNFLSKVKQRPVDFFTTPDNLAQKIASSIGRTIAELKAAEEAARQAEINVHVGGNFNGNLTIGDHNTSNNINNDYQINKHPNSTLPTLPFFFGRTDELKAISAALEPDIRAWGILIFGEGGIGKTALAIEAAHQVSPSVFENKIFISAKERELTAKGEVSSKEFSQNSYLSILNEVAMQLGEEGIPRLVPEERTNALLLVLKSKKTLLILDNLETLNNDDRDRLYLFLDHLPPGNKAIVTNRRRDETFGRTIRLDQLKQTEAEKLISELSKRNPRLLSIEDKEKEELFIVASGNPLIIRWIIGQVGREGTYIKTISEAIKFMRQAPPQNDPLEYVFGDLLKSLIPSERVILTIMVFLNPPKIEWAAKITGYSEKSIEMICDELVNRSILVTLSDSNDYFLPHITRQFIKNKLPKEVSETEEKIAQHAFRIIMELGGRKSAQEQTSKCWPLLFSSLPFFIKNDNEKLQIICDTLDTFLSSGGLIDEWLWLNQQAEIVALLHGDYDNAGMRAYKVGLIYSIREQSAEVLTYAKRAENNWKEAFLTKESFRSVKPYISYLRGIGFKLNNNYRKAIEEVKSSIEIWGTFAPEGIDLANSLNLLGEIQIETGEVDEAEKNIKIAIQIAEKKGLLDLKPRYMGNLALLAFKNKDWIKATILANDALHQANKLSIQEEIARQNLILASAYLELGHVGDKGLRTSQEAVDIYKRLKRPELKSAEEILLKWQRKMGIKS